MISTCKSSLVKMRRSSQLHIATIQRDELQKKIDSHRREEEKNDLLYQMINMLYNAVTFGISYVEVCGDGTPCKCSLEKIWLESRRAANIATYRPPNKATISFTIALVVSNE